jgi:hypothetical protein
MSKTMMWSRVDDNIRDMVKKLAVAKGISMSEYVRNLIIEDLDKRTVFTSALKAGVSTSPIQKEEQLVKVKSVE